jgi:hypothetical protein
MNDARPTLSREHSHWPEFVQRHADYCLGGLDLDAAEEVRARALPQLTGRRNARAHAAEDGSGLHHDAREALSFCIALLGRPGLEALSFCIALLGRPGLRRRGEEAP